MGRPFASPRLDTAHGPRGFIKNVGGGITRGFHVDVFLTSRGLCCLSFCSMIHVSGYDVDINRSTGIFVYKKQRM